MRRLNQVKLLSLVLMLALSLTTTACDVQSRADIPAPQPRNLSPASPEDAGMSTERLGRLSAAMQNIVDEGELAGITSMVARHGKVVYAETFGHQEIASDTKMDIDTIFRIYSMSKPITGVAMMLLYEEGKFRLSDPVEKYIPELEGLEVAAGEGKDGPIVEEADHPMTIRELMSHTAGLSYGIFSQSQADDMYQEVNVLDSNRR